MRGAWGKVFLLPRKKSKKRQILLPVDVVMFGYDTCKVAAILLSVKGKADTGVGQGTESETQNRALTYPIWSPPAFGFPVMGNSKCPHCLSWIGLVFAVFVAQGIKPT